MPGLAARYQIVFDPDQWEDLLFAKVGKMVAGRSAGPTLSETRRPSPHPGYERHHDCGGTRARMFVFNLTQRFISHEGTQVSSVDQADLRQGNTIETCCL